MADLYRTKVEQFAAAFQADGSRLEASETLRGLIDSIVLTPGPPSRAGGQSARYGAQGTLRIELRGNLAAMLTWTACSRRATLY